MANISHLENPNCFFGMLDDVAAKNFVVYAKKPFAGPKQVVKYLGKYTHRIAISNYRLKKLEGERVYFSMRNKSSPTGKKITSLHVEEFMRRFLLHFLPKGFVRIRHFGFLGSRYKKDNIELIRKLLGYVHAAAEKAKTWKEFLLRKTDIDPDQCPKCKNGALSEEGYKTEFLNSS